MNSREWALPPTHPPLNPYFNGNRWSSGVFLEKNAGTIRILSPSRLTGSWNRPINVRWQVWGSVKKKALRFRPANSTGSPSNQFVSLSVKFYFGAKFWAYRECGIQHSLSIITFFWFTQLLTTTNCTLVSGLEALPSRHVVDWSSRLLRLLHNSDIVKNRFPLHCHGFFNSTLLMSEIKWEWIVLGLIEKRKE